MLRRDSAERAATLSLANALYSVKFPPQTRAGNLRPGTAFVMRLHQLRVQHNLRIVREQFRNRAASLRIRSSFVENFFRRARNGRRRVQHNSRNRKAAVNFGQRHRCLRLNLGRRQSRTAQLRSQRHRKAARVRRRNQLFGSGAGCRALEPRCEGVVRVLQHACRR